MGLTPGARVGAYEVLGRIGAGGMGEVYRAHDTRLNRDVALKVLPDALGADPERLARLRREAQMLAALNHPNIAHVYGLEDSDGAPAVVMELVEGPTLADAIAAAGLRGTIGARGMPLEQAIPIARQIAEALEAAHEAGIVHRDLKPANIKVRDDGTVKVLDFGLAKAEGEGVVGADARISPVPPTMTSPAITAMGVILGTAAYISPEQAKGRVADKRADVWAFGCVLWEMLAGEALFGRETMTETVAAVLRDDPRYEMLPANTPPWLQQLIARCLERDPKQRLRDIGEARILLARPPEAPGPAATRTRPRIGVVTALGAVALAATAAGAAWHLKTSTLVPLRRLDLPAEIAAGGDFALSPDGTRIAYLARGHLYVRALDALDALDLGPVPVASESLIWSPDSRTIAFAGGGELRSIPADGGPAFTICRIPVSGRTMGAAWLANGNIVFTVWRDSLYTVPSVGGTPSVSLAIDAATEVDFHHVSELPDGRLIVQTHGRRSDSDVAEIVDGTRRTRLSSDRLTTGFDYAPPGFLLFVRRTVNAGLWAVPFTGSPPDLTKAILIQAGAGAYSVARDRTAIVALPAVVKSSLVWVDRAGAASPAGGPPIARMPTPDLALSPDGRRVAFVEGSAAENVVVRDLGTGVDTRLTLNSPDDASVGTWSETLFPAWFPSGDRLLHGTGKVEAFKLVARRADVAGSARELTSGVLGRISQDGRTLAFTIDDRGRRRLQEAPLLADGRLGPARPLLQDAQDVRDFDLSPDGRLVAYVVREANGRSDVFLADRSGNNEGVQVTEGGSRPRFARNGRELFFVKGSLDEAGRPIGQMMAATIAAGPTLTLSASVRLFDDAGQGAPDLSSYDVAPDGRFLMRKPIAPGPGEGTRMVLVQNWPAAVEK